MIKWINLLVTLIIMIILIVTCCVGKDALWIYVFTGWGFVLLYDIKYLIKKKDK